tara:strand:- start:100 stop:930 length:831 start_codon:yes stop_codon:yes gene_type:complete
MSLGKLFKKLAPIAISAFAGPAIGAGIGQAFSGSALSPFISRALTGAVTSKLMGGRNKDALRNALLSGIGGMAIDKFSGAENLGADAQRIADNRLTDPIARRQGTGAFTGSSPNVSKPPVEQAIQRVQGSAPKTFSGELLQAAGVSDDNLLSKLLNTRVGEGLTAGLIAQLLAGDEEEDTRTEFEKRPFGFGGPGGQLGGIRFAADGGLSDPMGFPRRNGGIDPSEGSGTKDDVPAMLMAGEFVLTKDAVKGLGDGNQRKGIQRAYDMMDKLEARA